MGLRQSRFVILYMLEAEVGHPQGEEMCGDGLKTKDIVEVKSYPRARDRKRIERYPVHSRKCTRPSVPRPWHTSYI